jgi:hypothetical protein
MTKAPSVMMIGSRIPKIGIITSLLSINNQF